MIQSNVIPKLPSGYNNIEQSLRFNDNDSAFLSRTPSVAGNRKTWTFSTWVKRGNLGTSEHMFSGQSGASVSGGVIINASGNLGVSLNGNLYNKYTNAVLRDTSSWYHIVAIYDSTQAVAENRIRLYVNGVEQISYFTQNSGLPPQNYDSPLINNTNLQTIGGLPYYGYYRDGYLAETHFIDGLALTPDYFGEFDANYGHWKPKKYSGTYGINGFYLPYSNGGNIGEDNSGNGNNFTATNLNATDIVLDSPTNNFATLNVINKQTSLHLTEGNLKTVNPANVWSNGVASTFDLRINAYWEVNVILGAFIKIGLQSNSNYTTEHSLYIYDTTFNGSAYGGINVSNGDVFMFAWNAISGTLWIGRNGSWFNSATLAEIEANITTHSAITGLSNEWTPAVTDNYNSVSAFNFGQDSSFAGNKTAQGYTDSNGIGDFYYQPPDGYLALCTANLPEPTVVPSEHFDVVLDTGANIKTSSEALFPTFLEWIKDRANVNNHQLIDTVRGTSAVLQSNTTIAESTYLAPSGSSVGWIWKAGGNPVTNTNGTTTSQVSANVDAGFSIVSYTMPSSGGFTVGHGLSNTPEMIIVKSRDGAYSWLVYHKDLTSANYYLSLNSTNQQTVGGMWNYTDPTSSVFSSLVGTTGLANEKHIAYCFHSVEGYSKVFSYKGNNSADGTFVYLGFQARFVMVKIAIGTTGYWIIVDTERNTYNVVDDELYPNASSAENAFDYIDIDIVSNGIKFRSNNANSNGSTSYEYIGYAVAEVPFKFSNAK